MAFLEGIDLGKTIHLWGLLPGTTRFQETVCVVESFQPCLDDEDGHLAFQWGAKQLSGTLKFSENSSGLTLIVTTAGIQSEESRTAQFNRTQLCHMTPLSLATTNLQEQGDGLPITTIVNDLKPPEVVRVKIFDSEKHIVERVIMDMISILPITDNFTKAIKAGSYARKGWEYFSKFLSGGKIINGYITLTEDVDTGLFPEDSVRRKPNRTDKLAPNNHVVVERFSTDPVRGITIEVFEKTRADNQTWLLSNVVKYGDTHGWSRKVIPLTLRTPRRGIRLKHMKPSGSWIHHDKYPENDIVGCVYALAPGQGDDLLPAVYFYPDVFKSSTVENQKIMGYDNSFNSYLILSEIGDGSDRIQILRPGGWDGRLLIRLKDVVIRSPNSEGEDLGTQDSEYGSSKQTGVVTLIKEDLVDKVRPPVAYCWRDSHFVFRLDKCPTSNITTDYQYYMERNSGSYSYLILDEWVTVPGV